eukprot:1885088-Prymnesium_polylepis.1
MRRFLNARHRLYGLSLQRRTSTSYKARLKAARAGGGSSAAVSTPTAAAAAVQQLTEPASLSAFVLWELRAIYGRRMFDPETLSDYELRNGVSDEREEELSNLIYAHWKENAADEGWSQVAWVKLETIVKELNESELHSGYPLDIHTVRTCPKNRPKPSNSVSTVS